MSTKVPQALLPLAYEQWAQEYLRSLPPEHFMEATGQSGQRKITLESLDLVSARRPDVHVFNELLVQYPVRGQRKPGQVVPDNMIVVTDQPIRAQSSYNLPLEPAGPVCVMEYVSNSNKRKDYEDSSQKYERELKVPYYLLFYPEAGELTLYRHNKRKYISVRPNEHDRYAIPELDLEVALLDGWVRYWYQGELLPLPADLQRDLDTARQQRDDARRQAEDQQRRADALEQRLAAVERELAEMRSQRNRPA